MSAASDFLEVELLDHVLTGSTYTPPANVYVALFTASTGLETNDPSAEVNGGDYSRKQASFAAAQLVGGAGSSSTDATITFDTATANWGTITHIAVMDAASQGNVLFHGPVTTPKTIETGDTFQISAGNLTITLD